MTEAHEAEFERACEWVRNAPIIDANGLKRALQIDREKAIEHLNRMADDGLFLRDSDGNFIPRNEYAAGVEYIELLQKDSKMLNFLTGLRGNDGNFTDTYAGGGKVSLGDGDWFKTPREAIEAAMKGGDE